MPTDADFLAAIAAAPLDSLPKLVYADWLDEQSDPRGELLRLDHALATQPPTTDEYWDWHAKREGLRVNLDAGWVDAVRVGHACSPLLAHGWPDDVRGRWRTVRAAAERLLGKTLGVPADVAGAVAEANAATGLAGVLVEWVSFVLDARETAVGFAFLEEFSPVLGRGNDPSLILLEEVGADTVLAVPVESPSADPPVYPYLESDDEVWERDEDDRGYASVSELALFRLLSECYGTGGWTSSTLADTTKLREQLAAVFPPPVEFRHVDLYERPGVLVEIYSPRNGPAGQVTVRVQAAVPDADVPDFLFGLFPRRRRVSGLFVPAPLREPDPRPRRLPADQWLTDPAAVAYQRGQEFRFGTGGREQNDAEAVRWYRIAADMNHPAGTNDLGYMLQNGYGAPPDPAAAVPLYHRAADLGSEWGNCNYAISLRDGKHVPQDLPEAVRRFRKSADAGLGFAFYLLGCLYQDGLGVEKSEEEAHRLFLRGADKGYAACRYRIAKQFANGRGVPQDHAAAAKWYRKGADARDSDSMNELGNLHWEGKGVAKDDAEAVKWYQKAIDQTDNRVALYNLANAYRLARGVERDLAKACDLYRRSAANGYTKALWALGMRHQAGEGVEKNPERAVELFREGAAADEPNAMNSLGYAFDMGRGVAKDHVEALKWYRKAAEHKLDVAVFNVGCSYRDGQGTDKDVVQAAEWFRRAADLGYVTAMYEMGIVYRDGRGARGDKGEAYRWFKLAADAGNAKAMNSLANCYRNGSGVDKDYDRMLAWYTKGADAGNEVAMYNLGVVYRDALGVPTDHEKAVEWFRKAIAAGDRTLAVNDLGLQYERGHGVPQDYAEALRYYREAAEAGSLVAARNTGEMHEQGKGTPKDTAEALRWYRLAADKGDERAKGRVKKLEG